MIKCPHCDSNSLMAEIINIFELKGEQIYINFKFGFIKEIKCNKCNEVIRDKEVIKKFNDRIIKFASELKKNDKIY